MLRNDTDLYALIAEARTVNELIRLARQNGLLLTRSVAQRLFRSVHADAAPPDMAQTTQAP